MPSPEITAAYERLTAAAAQIEQERKQVKSLILREFAHRTEQREIAKSAGITPVAVMLSMSFKNVSGRHEFYDHREQSHDELLSALVVSHNRQYQWLLAEAFEHFEDFLKDAYGCAGAKDPATWTNEHLKAIGSHVGMPTCWWVERARELKHLDATRVARRLRTLSGVSHLEANNALSVDLKLVLFIIERMRHLIVHRRGQAESAAGFAAAIAKFAGVATPTPEILGLVGQYFGDGRMNTTIHLLDHRLPDSGDGLQRHVDKFDQLLGWLLAYAHMVTARL